MLSLHFTQCKVSEISVGVGFLPCGQMLSVNFKNIRHTTTLCSLIGQLKFSQKKVKFKEGSLTVLEQYVILSGSNRWC